MTVVGLLLAAGAGRRLGRPKALVRPAPDAPTFLETAVTALHEAGLDRVVVVLGAAAEDAVPVARGLGVTVVEANDWSEGMGASLRTGLRHLDGAAPAVERALVTLVDLPDVGADVHRRLLAAATGPAALARATYDGRPGHPVVLGRDHWGAVVDSAVGDRGARSYLEAAGALAVECGDLATGRDVDTADDLGRVPRG